MPSAYTDNRRAGTRSGNDCWTTRARTEPAATRRTAAGRPSGPFDRSTAPPRMAPKHHPTPLSGGDRKALGKELGKARAMTTILAEQSTAARAKGEALIEQADRLLCESWNERMWANGEPIDPLPAIDQAINGGYPWLEIQCSRCKTRRDWLHCRMQPQPLSMTSLAGSGATNVLRRDAVLRRRCCNSCAALAPLFQRRDDVQSLLDDQEC
ncbi:hypothetical protein FBZ96_12032 [Bradyrhizobium stylosanthis]|uniref:Uncharacterized protein n=1 Tax=Bradyrhizobium stylosanthis TaxID=1803665 RepID=A0A560CX26_9BRAD|nr:hypothetical protein FBZ96_12032 [Bradyrhizobium stylosanthis]